MTRVSTPSSFFFVALRPTGGRKVGLRHASNQRALVDSLRAERLMLLKSYRLPGWFAPSGEMSLNDQVQFNDALSRLINRGVPLVEALDVTLQAVRPAMQPKVRRIRDAVAGGANLSDACRAARGFDEVTLAIYRASERSGELGPAAKQLAYAAKRRKQVAGKALTVMLYPAIVLTISLLVAFGLLVFFVPMIGEQLGELSDEISMPVFSQIMMQLGATLRDNIAVVLIGAGVALFFAVLLRGAILAGIRSLMPRMPMVGPIVLAQEAARFFAIMAAMSRTGVPLADALAVANQAVKHATLRKQLDRVRTRLIGGGVLRTLIDSVTALPPSVRQMLVAGERAGDLDSTFAALADDMSEEVETRTSRVLGLIQPLATVFMAIIIGGVIAAVLLPIISLPGQIN